MKRAVLGLALALAAGPALATPLSDALDAGPLCFTGVASAPAGQSWKQVVLSLTRDRGPDNAPTARLSLQGAGKPLLIHAACTWMEGNINRGGGDRILDPTFLPTSGVTCFMATDLTGASAEEGGSFPVDWADGQTLAVHLPFTVAAWRGYDTRRAATWPEVAVADRIVRVSRAAPEACAELRAKFAPAG